jgi:hypothetical protein
MKLIMDPAIAFRVPPHERPTLEVRVNFGMYAGRNATAAEIDDLARSLRTELLTFSVIAEDRHQFGDDVEMALHQVVIEVEHQNAGALSDDARERVVEMANRWAAACIASRTELGELGSV